LLAIGPALLAAPRGRRRLGAVTAGVCAAWFGAALVVAPDRFVHSLGGLSSVAHPQELWSFNHVYDEIPFVFAFVAWQTRSATAPLLSLLATGLLCLVFGPIATAASPSAQWLAYVVVTVPFVAALTRSALGWTARWPELRGSARAGAA
jgi:hypothetical protein